MQQMSGKAKSWPGGGLEERIVGEVDLKQMKGANEDVFLWLRIP